MLLRLHDGTFRFDAAKEDGSDIRLVAEDGKTLLPYHLEKYDPLLNEAFVWVKVPDLQPNAQRTLWLYYGNAGPKATPVADAKGSWAPEVVLAYHFGERGAPAADATGHGLASAQPVSPVDGALIGGGAKLEAGKTLALPADTALAWRSGSPFTWSLWLKAAALQPNAIVFSRSEAGVTLTIGEANGLPYVDVSGQRISGTAAVAAGAWHHIAVTYDGAKLSLYVNGERAGELAITLPPLNGEGQLGAAADGFVGEIDELQISRVALPAGAIKLAATSQGGSEQGAKLLLIGSDEQHESWFSGGTFGVIIGSLTFDGWVVICVLGVMFAISWWLMITKVRYLNAVARGNGIFIKAWSHLATDLTALDDGDAEKVKTLGGRAADKKAQRALRQSCLYRIYHIGSEEIRHRMATGRGGRVLSTRSIQAIRAALDGGQVREKQGIDNLIVLLIICISGGPFLGLLGTVVGVMITFAAVAAAGEVNVNAIAPGIAAALLATVAGLAVAIPALFGYNYILARVKDATADMHVFIDEFVTKMAESYSEDEPPQQRGASSEQVFPEARELEAAVN